MEHPLHKAVADRIAEACAQNFEVIRDPACGGDQQLPLFLGERKSRGNRMCCVDLLLLKDKRVRGIVEIEEAEFLPTTICGKFLQAGLADHFIHENRSEGPVPYAERVLFLQVLDGNACPREGGSKEQQGKLIEKEIRKLLPLRGLTDYGLVFVNGSEPQSDLYEVETIVNKLN